MMSLCILAQGSKRPFQRYYPGLRHTSRDLDGLRIAMVPAAGSLSADAISTFHDGLGVYCAMKQDASRLDLASRLAQSAIDVLVIDGSNEPSAERLVDFCMETRRTVPSMPLLLVSRWIRLTDLSRERAPICDASIHIPCGRSSIMEALAAAVENHRQTCECASPSSRIAQAW
ncbi:MAG: hypothetical protein KGN33_12625 [Paracoccaceae bacterium]|nr:hypothetical protein [Paracoccaceae bacterium]